MQFRRQQLINQHKRLVGDSVLQVNDHPIQRSTSKLIYGGWLGTVARFLAPAVIPSLVGGLKSSLGFGINRRGIIIKQKEDELPLSKEQVLDEISSAFSQPKKSKKIGKGVRVLV